jgi:Uma2 family endonuclease
LGEVATLVLGPPPPELSEFLERRRSLGQDLYDEVWEGVYHVAPAANAWHGYAIQRVAQLLEASTSAAGLIATSPFNLGERDDFRVPDLGYHRDIPTMTFVPTAAIVVEVVSPDDRSYAKLPFYAAHGVDEVLIVDAGSQAARWFVNDGGGYEERDASRLAGVTGAEIVAGLRWPV